MGQVTCYYYYYDVCFGSFYDTHQSKDDELAL